MDPTKATNKLPFSITNNTTDQVWGLTDFELVVPRSSFKNDIDDHELLVEARRFTYSLDFWIYNPGNHDPDEPPYFSPRTWEVSTCVLDTVIFQWMAKIKEKHVTYADEHYVWKLQCKFLRNTLFLPPGYTLSIPDYLGLCNAGFRCKWKTFDLPSIQPLSHKPHRHLHILYKTTTCVGSQSTIADFSLNVGDVFIFLICKAKIKGVTLVMLNANHDVTFDSHELTKMKTDRNHIGYVIPLGQMPLEVARRSLRTYNLEDCDLQYGKFGGPATLYIHFESPEEHLCKMVRISTLHINELFFVDDNIQNQQYIYSMATAETSDSVI
uniref:Uncharacterized protein n=1 Tax=Clandestinovirus TaxID=2831644 RepID=A0A8F8KNV8_9VIRU|nr:hypothetical protein KOM_12_91 [Clandestinovirus]